MEITVASVVLCFLGIMFVLAFVPAVFSASVRGQSILFRVYILGVRVFRLKGEGWPDLIEQLKKKIPKRKSKKEKPPQKTKSTANKTDSKKSKKQWSVEELIALVKQLATTADATIRLFLRLIWFYDIEVVIPAEGKDAHAVAMEYGKMQALLGGAHAILNNIAHLRFKRMMVIPHFAGPKVPAEFAVKVALSPAVLMMVLLYAVVRFIRESPMVEKRKRRRRVKKILRMRKKRRGSLQKQTKAN